MLIRSFDPADLDRVLALCEMAGEFRTLREDPPRTLRALTSAGAVPLLAERDGELVGFSHGITDGAIQVYLCYLLVAPAARRAGVGRRLIEETLARSGAIRLDLLTSDEGRPLYESFPYDTWPGFRLYPEGKPGPVG